MDQWINESPRERIYLGGKNGLDLFDTKIFTPGTSRRTSVPF